MCIFVSANHKILRQVKMGEHKHISGSSGKGKNFNLTLTVMLMSVSDFTVSKRCYAYAYVYHRLILLSRVETELIVFTSDLGIRM